MPALLVVEDEDHLAEIIIRELKNAGYTVIHAKDGLSALQLHTQHQFDTIILDWMLPELDGISLLKHIRKSSGVPILMLTGRDTEDDRVMGIEMGADDYLTKPFSTRELVVRVQALLRRADLIRQTIEQDQQTSTIALTRGSLTLDPETFAVELDGDSIELSPLEFNLLYLLMSNPGRTFTRTYLIDAVWNNEYISGDRSVDNTVRRIRNKIGHMADYIEAKWGVGYRWRRE